MKLPEAPEAQDDIPGSEFDSLQEMPGNDFGMRPPEEGAITPASGSSKNLLGVAQTKARLRALKTGIDQPPHKTVKKQNKTGQQPQPSGQATLGSWLSVVDASQQCFAR